MKALQIVGAVLIAAGLYVLIKSPTFSRQESVLKIGTVEATVQRQQDIPAWAGGAAIAAGIVLIVVGARKS
jgi:type II secretory pathway component PulM